MVTKRKQRSPSKKREDKLIAIGRVACNLITKKGYFETSLEDIAAEAGISKGALYHYFPSKTALLYFILKRFGDRLLLDLEEELDRIDDDFYRIRYIIFRHIALSVEYKAEAKALINAKYSLPKKYFKVVTGQEKKYYRIVEGVLSRVLAGRFNEGQINAITFSMFGMCNWIYTWYDSKGAVSPEELSQIIYDIFVSGLNHLLSAKDPGGLETNAMPAGESAKKKT